MYAPSILFNTKEMDILIEIEDKKHIIDVIMIEALILIILADPLKTIFMTIFYFRYSYNKQKQLMP
jgi:hypothetical protein